MIYLIKSGNYYKIGFTNNIQKRIDSYKTYNPNIELIGYKLGTKQDEQQYHKRLQQYRVYRKEWFNIKDEDLLKTIIMEFKDIDYVTYCKKIKVEPIIPEEIYDEFIIFNSETSELNTYYLTTTRLCLGVISKQLYDIEVNSIKTFTLDKDWEWYSGIIINDNIILYNYRNKEFPEFNSYYSNITNSESSLYKILKEKNLIETYNFN